MNTETNKKLVDPQLQLTQLAIYDIKLVFYLSAISLITSSFASANSRRPLRRLKVWNLKIDETRLLVAITLIKSQQFFMSLFDKTLVKDHNVSWYLSWQYSQSKQVANQNKLPIKQATRYLTETLLPHQFYKKLKCIRPLSPAPDK